MCVGGENVCGGRLECVWGERMCVGGECVCVCG